MCEMLRCLGVRWVVFGDADDKRREGAIEALWENRVKGGVAVGSVVWHYLDGRERLVRPNLGRRGFIYRWHYCAAIWDIDVVTPLLNPDYRISWDMMVAYQAVNTVPVKVVNTVTYDWYQREGSLTTSEETGMKSAERVRVNAELSALMR